MIRDNIHYVRPHWVQAHFRADGTFVEGYWRDGDGDTSIDLNVFEGGGYYRSNPDGYLYNNLSFGAVNPNQHNVNGYYRKDGTYVEEYSRTNPDDSIDNNLNNNYGSENSTDMNSQRDINDIDIIAGNPTKSAAFFDLQDEDPTCATRVQQSVIEEVTGKDISNYDADKIAIDEGWYIPMQGTHPQAIGNLLSEYNINIERGYNWNIEELIQSLNSNEKVIVGLNANEIWSPMHDSDGIPIQQDFAGHAVRVTGIGVDEAGEYQVIISDSSTADREICVVSLKDFLNAWQDTRNFSVITDLNTDPIRPDYQDFEVSDFDNETVSYIIAVDTSQYGDLRIGDMTNGEVIDHSVGDLFPDMANAFATGGFLALFEIFKDDQEKQKKVIKAGVMLGILDGIYDVNDTNSSFEINPLLIVSLASWIAIIGKNAKNEKVQALANGFNNVSRKAFKGMEYTAYSAMGINAIDFLTPGIDIVDAAGGWLDNALGAADVFANAVDFASTMGLSIAATKFVKHGVDKMNGKDQEEISELKGKVAMREVLRTMIKEDAHPKLLTAVLTEVEK